MRKKLLALVIILLIIAAALVYTVMTQKHIVTADSIKQHYGETGKPGWIPEDLNKDGVVNYLDASLFVSRSKPK